MIVSNKYFFSPGALSIKLNADTGFKTSESVVVSTAAGAAVRVANRLSTVRGKSIYLGYSSDLNYRKYTFSGVNTILGYNISNGIINYLYTAADIYVYICLDASDLGSTGRIVFLPYELDYDGSIIEHAVTGEEGNESSDFVAYDSIEVVTLRDDLGSYKSLDNANEKNSTKLSYIYIHIATIASAEDASVRGWKESVDCGSLDTAKGKEEVMDSGIEKMFKMVNNVINVLLPFDGISFALSGSNNRIKQFVTLVSEKLDDFNSWRENRSAIASVASISSFVSTFVSNYTLRFFRRDTPDTNPNKVTFGEVSVEKGLENVDGSSSGNLSVGGSASVAGSLSVTGDASVTKHLSADSADIATSASFAHVYDPASKRSQPSTVIDDDGIATSSVRSAGDITVGQYSEGIAHGSLQGMLFKSDGHGSMKSLSLSEYLEVPELRYNRITVESGTSWQAHGAGLIMDVYQDVGSNGTLLATGHFDLRLEEGEVGTFAAGDICMGIWHFLGDKASYNASEEDAAADDNGLTVAGFATVYFTVTSVENYTLDGISYVNGRVNYKVRGNGYNLHPMAHMAIVSYGSFTDKSRQDSRYSTPRFTRHLYNVNTWSISTSNVAMQTGDCSNLNLYLKDGSVLNLSGYSGFLSNIYFKGHIEQIDVSQITDDNGLLVNRNYSIDLSQVADVVTVNEQGFIEGGLVVSDSLNSSALNRYRFSSAITVRKNGSIITDCSPDVPNEGSYRLTAVAYGCTCEIINSTLYITAIDGVRTDSPLTDEQLIAMRQLESCSVEVVAECEGEAVLHATYTLSFNHSSSYILLDLNNEIDSVACSVDGASIGEQVIETTACLFVGTSPIINGASYPSGVLLNGIASTETVSSDGVTYKWTFPANTQFDNPRYAASISLTYKGQSYSKLFSLNAIRASKDGETPTIYNLRPSLSSLAFSVSADNTYSPSSYTLSCGYVKRTGESTPVLVDNATSAFDGHCIFYRNVAPDGASSWTPYTASLTLYSGITGGIEFAIVKTPSGLFDESAVIDRELVPVVKSGQKGDPGNPGTPGKPGHSPEVSIGANGNWFIDNVDTSVSAYGKQGNPGPVAPILRPAGQYSSSATYYNNSAVFDVVWYNGHWYRLKEGHNEVNGGTPSETSAYWEIFSNFNNIATSAILASSGYIDVLGSAAMFIGNSASGVVHNTDGSTSIGSEATGWLVSQGSIRHINKGVPELTLTADGRLIDPDGLHLEAGNNTLSVRPNMAKEALWRTGSPFSGATGTTGISGTVEIVDSLGDAYSPWAGDRGRILAMKLKKLLSTSNNNLFNALASLPQSWYGLKLEAGKKYTLSLWVKVGCEDMLVPSSDVAEVRQYTSLTGTSDNGYIRVYMQVGDMEVAGWRQCSLTVTGNANYPYLSWIPLCHISENLIPNPVLCDRTSGGSYVAHPYSSAAGAISGITATISVFGVSTVNPWYKDGGRVISIKINSNSLSSVGYAYAQFASTADAPVAVTTGGVYRFSVWAQVQGTGNVPTNGVIGELDYYASTSSTTIVARAYVTLANYVRDEGSSFKLYSVAVTVPSGAGAVRWRPCVQVAAGKSGFTVAWAGARLSKGSDIKGMLFGGMSEAYIAYAGFKVEEGDKPSAMTYGTSHALLNAGIDITDGSITNYADKWEVRNLAGERTAFCDDTGTFISTGVQMSMVNSLDWANNIGRDKLIVIVRGTPEGGDLQDMGWLDLNGVWRDFDGNALPHDAGSYDEWPTFAFQGYRSYIDVLRVGTILTVYSLPYAAIGTSGSDQRQIHLPYYIDSYSNERGYTRFGERSTSIPRLMKADEMRMLEGKHLTLRFDPSLKVLSDYTSIGLLFFFDTNVDNFDRLFFNGIREVDNPIENNYVKWSAPINAGRILTLQCNVYYFKSVTDSHYNKTDPCVGYAWTFTSDTSIPQFDYSGLDGWT